MVAKGPSPTSPASPEESGVRVSLDLFTGPLDLLLHLVREEELEVQRIPVARIADQYIAFLEAATALDLAVAGDFLVMAATLLEMKSRSVLPEPPPLEPGEEGDEAWDVKTDFVQKLLEYRRVKELGRSLASRAAERALRFSRPGPLGGPDEAPAPSLAELGLEDRVAAFARVARETLLTLPRTILYADVPIAEHIARVRSALAGRGTALLADLVPSGADKRFLVGTFVALLELIRQGEIGVDQDAPFGAIRVFRRSEGGETQASPGPAAPAGPGGGP